MAKPRRRSIKTLDKQIEIAKKEIALQKLNKMSAMLDSSFSSSGYTAGSVGKRDFRYWLPSSYSGDATYLNELPLIRQRASDLFRNSSIASGALRTAASNVIGSGLTMQCSIDRKYLSDRLGWTDEQCEEWEYNTERLWRKYWDSTDPDLTGRMTGPELEYLAYLTYRNEGETFVLLPRKENEFGNYDLKIQLLGASRVSSPYNKWSDRYMRDGVEVDDYGSPIAYHVQKESMLYEYNINWERIEAKGADSGRNNILHIFKPDFVDQTRGIPWITTIIPEIKTVSEYENHERIRAMVSNLFAGFVKSNRSDALEDIFADDPIIADGSRAVDRDKDYTLSPGIIHKLEDDEDITFANPAAPNPQFGEFIRSNLRQMGMHLGIPVDYLIKEYNASYTASKAGRIDAWRFFSADRTFFVQRFDKPIYMEWLSDQIANGIIEAPGFLEDGDLRSAFSSSTWVGESQGQIDPVRETQAAVMRVQNGFTTTAFESASIGQDFEKNIRKIPRERTLLEEAGLIQGSDTAQSPPPDQNTQNESYTIDNSNNSDQNQQSARIVRFPSR